MPRVIHSSLNTWFQSEEGCGGKVRRTIWFRLARLNEKGEDPVFFLFFWTSSLWWPTYSDMPPLCDPKQKRTFKSGKKVDQWTLELNYNKLALVALARNLHAAWDRTDLWPDVLKQKVHYTFTRFRSHIQFQAQFNLKQVMLKELLI